MRLIFLKGINTFLILAIILISLVKNNYIDSKTKKINKSSNNSKIKKNINKVQNIQAILDEIINYFENLNQEIINNKVNKSISDKINEILYIKLYTKLLSKIQFMIISEFKKHLNNKIDYYKELIRKKIMLDANININNNNFNLNNEEEEKEIIKDCVEYGLSPIDENYIICNKYELFFLFICKKIKFKYNFKNYF